ncbi:MAG: SRPBCC family protein [Holophagaceae bacterium]|nr:SRPBCC family protein [Holophagaceae bacterium]
MTDYAFQTHWTFKAPLEQVWPLIHDVDAWPSWWRGVEKVEVLEPGDAQGIGSLRRFTWKGTLPYRLRFNLRATRIDAPSLIEGDACGELEGVGRWLLRQDGAWTTVRYDWNVRTTKAWMNWFAFLLKGPFRRNHDRVMGWGAEGLAKRLGCEWECEG